MKIKRASQYTAFVKALAKYLNVDAKNQTHESFHDDQIKEDAKKFSKTLEDLGPTFIKLGQVLATRKSMLPAPFIQELQRMQDDVKPIETSVVMSTIENELGTKIDDIFKEFTSTPISTASLGQVHRAVLKTGKEVVVKVQKPGITKIIEDDLKVIGKSVKLLNEVNQDFKRYHIQGILDDFSENIRRELDYKEEAFNLENIAKNLKDFEKIEFPNVYNSYSSMKIITMDFIDGEKVSNLSPLRKTEIEGEKIVEELFKAYLKQILVDGFIHTDPHLGNILLINNNKIGIIDLGMVTKVGPSIRKDLQHLMLCISDGRAKNAAELALKIATPMNDFEENVIEFKQKVYYLVKEEQGKPLEKIKVGSSLMSITNVAAETGFTLPNEFASIARTLMYLDDIFLCLAPGFNPQESLKKHVMKFVSKSYKENISFQSIFQDSMEFKDIAETLPRKINTILEEIIDRRLKLKIDVIDEEKLISGFEKIANRVTTGLIISSMIVGATSAMKYKSDFTILDFPGVAMILLSLATFGAILLMLNIFIKDK